MRVFLSIALIFVFGISNAQSSKEVHPIDKEYSTCLSLEKNYSTAGMVGCVSEALTRWDTELNIEYKKLMRLLNENQQQQLRTAQREWITYRDKEIEFIKGFYYEMGGTIWGLIAAKRQMNLTRARVLELEGYLEVLEAEY